MATKTVTREFDILEDEQDLRHQIFNMTRLLVAFDFDHTIVEENSDIVARKLIHMDLIPEDVRKLYQVKGWTDYMSEIFKLLHKHDVSKETIINAMQNLTPTPKMKELLEWLNRNGHEIIIISDSNSVFIDEWLAHWKLDECVRRVFTNPATFNDKGLLTIHGHHHQTWCKLSTENLCKGYILQTYLRHRQSEGVCFDLVSYVGDGHNDFCPSLKLSENDFVFPRVGYTLEKMIKSPPGEEVVVAKVHPWTSADDIRSVLENL